MDPRTAYGPHAQLSSRPVPAGSRGAIRRFVDLACELVCGHGDEPLSHRITDLSPGGAWIRTAQPLRAGEQLVLCFTPPGWRGEMMVFAEVVRVQSTRDPDDPAAGMAVELLDLSEREQRYLASWLDLQRQPVPRRRRPMPRREPALRVWR